MKDDLISRQAAIELLCLAIDDSWEPEYAVDRMEDLPSAQPEQKKGKWISVTERLPEVGKDVLCFCRANIYFVLGWDGYHWHEGVDRYYMSSFVTHWMPLPEPPTIIEAEDGCE